MLVSRTNDFIIYVWWHNTYTHLIHNLLSVTKKYYLVIRYPSWISRKILKKCFLVNGSSGHWTDDCMSTTITRFRGLLLFSAFSIVCYECEYNELKDDGGNLIWSDGHKTCKTDPNKSYTNSCYGACQVCILIIGPYIDQISNTIQ